MSKTEISIRIFMLIIFTILISNYIIQLLNIRLFIYDFQDHYLILTIDNKKTVFDIGASLFGVISYILISFMVIKMIVNNITLFLFLINRNRIEKNYNEQPSLIFNIYFFIFSFLIYMAISINLDSEIDLNQYKILRDSFKKDKFLKDYYLNNFDKAIPLTKRDYLIFIDIAHKHKLHIQEIEMNKERKEVMNQLKEIHND